MQTIVCPLWTKCGCMTVKRNLDVTMQMSCSYQERSEGAQFHNLLGAGQLSSKTKKTPMLMATFLKKARQLSSHIRRLELVCCSSQAASFK